MRGIFTKNRGGGAQAAFIAYATMLYLFLYLPIAVIILFAFDAKPIPGLPLDSMTADWFSAAINDAKLVGSLFVSIKLALISAALSTLLAMPSAMVLAWVPSEAWMVTAWLLAAA